MSARTHQQQVRGREGAPTPLPDQVLQADCLGLGRWPVAWEEWRARLGLVRLPGTWAARERERRRCACGAGAGVGAGGGGEGAESPAGRRCGAPLWHSPRGPALPLHPHFVLSPRVVKGAIRVSEEAHVWWWSWGCWGEGAGSLGSPQASQRTHPRCPRTSALRPTLQPLHVLYLQPPRPPPATPRLTAGRPVREPLAPVPPSWPGPVKTTHSETGRATHPDLPGVGGHARVGVRIWPVGSTSLILWGASVWGTWALSLLPPTAAAPEPPPDSSSLWTPHRPWLWPLGCCPACHLSQPPRPRGPLPAPPEELHAAPGGAGSDGTPVPGKLRGLEQHSDWGTWGLESPGHQSPSGLLHGRFIRVVKVRPAPLPGGRSPVLWASQPSPERSQPLRFGALQQAPPRLLPSCPESPLGAASSSPRLQQLGAGGGSPHPQKMRPFLCWGRWGGRSPLRRHRRGQGSHSAAQGTSGQGPPLWCLEDALP